MDPIPDINEGKKQVNRDDRNAVPYSGRRIQNVGP
jgi:hypothetical protein